MVGRKSLIGDVRVGMIARLLGDHRNAPNLWLECRIVHELDEFRTSAMNHATEASTAAESSMRVEGGEDAKPHRAKPHPFG